MVIKAQGVNKWFGSGESQIQVLKDINLEAHFEEMLYIVGPSGSGKTTLLSIISGVLRPDEGNVFIQGTDIWSLGDDERASFRLSNVGFVFQDFHLFPKLTCLENVAIPLILQQASWQEAMQKAEESLRVVGLGDKLQELPYRISIGQQQRVAIARAIASRPQILIFDEPTASLDGETGKKIISFVRDKLLNESRLVIVVTHDNRIEDYATRIIKLEDGRLLEVSSIR